MCAIIAPIHSHFPHFGHNFIQEMNNMYNPSSSSAYILVKVVHYIQPKNTAVSESTPLCMAIYIEPRFRIIMSHYTIVKVMQPLRLKYETARL